MREQTSFLSSCMKYCPWNAKSHFYFIIIFSLTLCSSVQVCLSNSLLFSKFIWKHSEQKLFCFQHTSVLTHRHHFWGRHLLEAACVTLQTCSSVLSDMWIVALALFREVPWSTRKQTGLATYEKQSIYHQVIFNCFRLGHTLIGDSVI